MSENEDEYQEFTNYNSSTIIRKRYEITEKTGDPDRDYINAPIDALGPPGRWIRHKLLESILYGTPVLVAIQQLRTKKFTKIMKFASILGTEEFYAVLLCFLTWIVDLRLGRLASIAMGIGFYVANAVKNAFCLPRPPSPPVRPLEDAYYTWGLPSHHSVLAVICPWYIWFYVLQHYHFQVTTLVCLFSFITLWSFMVMLCRIYNGVHSPADVVTGSLLGVMIVAFMNRFDNEIDLSSVMNGQSALILPIWLAILLILHPFNDVGIPAFEETNSMASVSVGIMLGKAFSHGKSPNFKALLETYIPGETSIFKAILFGFLRYFIGVIFIVLAKEISKFLTNLVISTFCKIFKINYIKKSPRSKFYTGYTENYLLPPIYKDRKRGEDDDGDVDDGVMEEKSATTSTTKEEVWNIGHYSRFVSYMCMGFVAYYCNNLFYQYVGLVL